MSEQAPKGLYVYQPFGSVSHLKHNAADRLFGVGGLPALATCQGFSRQECEAIIKALQDLADLDTER